MCFGINALSYIFVIAALILVRPIQTVGPKPPGHHGVRQALVYSAGRQQLWLPLLMMLIVGLFAFNFAVILPVLAKDTFHGSGGTYGLLNAMLSIGAITGSLAVGLVRHPRRPYLLVGALGFAVTLAATAAAPDVAVACVTLVLTGVTAFFFVTMCSTTLQLHSSAAFRGGAHGAVGLRLYRHDPHRQPPDGMDYVKRRCPRSALLVGSGACVVAAVIAAFVHTPPNPDQFLTDLAPGALAQADSRLRQPPTEVTQACATAAGCSWLDVTSRFSFSIAAVVSFWSILLRALATPVVSTDLRMTGTM